MAKEENSFFKCMNCYEKMGDSARTIDHRNVTLVPSLGKTLKEVSRAEAAVKARVYEQYEHSLIRKMKARSFRGSLRRSQEMAPLN